MSDQPLDVERLADALLAWSGATPFAPTFTGTASPREMAQVIAAEYARLASPGDVPDSLDAAWAEAEAALPEGWRIESVELSLWEASAGTTLWSADAGPADDSVGEYPEGLGPTPAAALRALAAKLRERQP